LGDHLGARSARLHQFVFGLAEGFAVCQKLRRHRRQSGRFQLGLTGLKNVRYIGEMIEQLA
jgi:hypothetical protein